VDFVTERGAECGTTVARGNRQWRLVRRLVAELGAEETERAGRGGKPVGSCGAAGRRRHTSGGWRWAAGGRLK
jgi:hypothetical protein